MDAPAFNTRSHQGQNNLPDMHTSNFSPDSYPFRPRHSVSLQNSFRYGTPLRQVPTQQQFIRPPLMSTPRQCSPILSSFQSHENRSEPHDSFEVSPPILTNEREYGTQQQFLNKTFTSDRTCRSKHILNQKLLGKEPLFYSQVPQDMIHINASSQSQPQASSVLSQEFDFNASYYNGPRSHLDIHNGRSDRSHPLDTQKKYLVTKKVVK